MMHGLGRLPDEWAKEKWVCIASTTRPIRAGRASFWREVAKEFISKSPNALDKNAKQIINIASILGGLYFSGITFSNLHNQIKDVWAPYFYLAPLFFILVSISASLYALFCNCYTVDMFASDAVKKAYIDIIKRKWRSICISGSSLALSIVFLMGAMWIYLTNH